MANNSIGNIINPTEAKPLLIASDPIKDNILQAIANAESTRDALKFFVRADFFMIGQAPAHRIWAAQHADVTMMVWERGTNVNDWVAKVQHW